MPLSFTRDAHLRPAVVEVEDFGPERVENLVQLRVVELGEIDVDAALAEPFGDVFAGKRRKERAQPHAAADDADWNAYINLLFGPPLVRRLAEGDPQVSAAIRPRAGGGRRRRGGGLRAERGEEPLGFVGGDLALREQIENAPRVVTH